MRIVISPVSKRSMVMFIRIAHHYRIGAVPSFSHCCVETLDTLCHLRCRWWDEVLSWFGFLREQRRWLIFWMRKSIQRVGCRYLIHRSLRLGWLFFFLWTVGRFL